MTPAASPAISMPLSTGGLAVKKTGPVPRNPIGPSRSADSVRSRSALRAARVGDDRLPSGRRARRRAPLRDDARQVDGAAFDAREAAVAAREDVEVDLAREAAGVAREVAAPAEEPRSDRARKPRSSARSRESQRPQAPTTARAPTVASPAHVGRADRESPDARVPSTRETRAPKRTSAPSSARAAREQVVEAGSARSRGPAPAGGRRTARPAAAGWTHAALDALGAVSARSSARAHPGARGCRARVARQELAADLAAGETGPSRGAGRGGRARASTAAAAEPAGPGADDDRVVRRSRVTPRRQEPAEGKDAPRAAPGKTGRAMRERLLGRVGLADGREPVLDRDARAGRGARPASETKSSRKAVAPQVEHGEALPRDHARELAQERPVLLGGEVVEEERRDGEVEGAVRANGQLECVGRSGRRGGARRAMRAPGREVAPLQVEGDDARRRSRRPREGLAAGRAATSPEPAPTSRIETGRAPEGADPRHEVALERARSAPAAVDEAQVLERCAASRRTGGRDRRAARGSAGAAGRGRLTAAALTTSALFFEPKPMQLQRACANEAGRARVGDVVEVALGVGRVEVDRRRQEPVAHPEQGRRDAGRAAGALRVADHRLDRGAGDPSRRAAEGEPGGARLDAVVQLGRGAVVREVVDRLGREPRLAERERHGPRRFLAASRPGARGGARRRSRRSRGSRRRRGAPRARARSPVLEHEHPGALAEDEPVAVARRRGARRARGSRSHAVETMRIMTKPSMMPRTTVASTPPASRCRRCRT